MPCSHAASTDDSFWTISCACCQSPASSSSTARVSAGLGLATAALATGLPVGGRARLDAGAHATLHALGLFHGAPHARLEILDDAVHPLERRVDGLAHAFLRRDELLPGAALRLRRL